MQNHEGADTTQKRVRANGKKVRAANDEMEAKN